MTQVTFRQFLEEQHVPQDTVEQSVPLAERFTSFIRDTKPAGTVAAPTAEDAKAFIATLVKEDADTWDSIHALLLYARFIQNRDIHLVALELIDGAEVMRNLYQKVGETIGLLKRNEVFEGITMPTTGISNVQKARLMGTVMERLERQTDPGTCKQLLSGCLRNLPDADYLEQKRKYEECGNIDVFLELNSREFIADLERLHAEGELFYNQEITPEVIAFVKSNPEIPPGGVRAGNVLYATKIPYMTKEYLGATEPDMKRYYYCHCPWARESLRKGEKRVSVTFCECSAGYSKRRWEVIFGQPLEAEVLESVLKGDLKCRFAVHLPADKL